ncbi:MAG: hypothetical protein R3C14_54545 [Caldilineaceae bacterium]
MSQFNQIHYKCSFRLIPAQDGIGWSDLIRDIRSWLSNNRNSQFNSDLGRSWFYTGGHKIRDPYRSSVETLAEIGTGTETEPQYWSLRFEHPDREFSFRQWRTDIGITVVDKEKFDFSLTLSHSLSTEYIGEEPEVPESTTPVLISLLLRSGNWLAFAGSQQLATGIVELDSDGVTDLWQQLTSPTRNCPVILMLPDKETGSINIDVEKLAKLLIGAAIVYVGNGNVYREVNRIFAENYRLYNGYVRIYLPRLQPERRNDDKRHRYFSGKDADSTDALLEMIVRNIARRERLAYSGLLTTIEDVADKQRELRLLTLRSAAKSADELEQLFDLLDDENKALRSRQNELIAQLNDNNEQYAKVIEDKDELAEKLQAAERAQAYVRDEANELRNQVAVYKTQLDAISLEKLPTTLIEVVEQIERFHPDRVAFTERAKTTAKDSSFKDIPTAWHCLWNVATVLHDLYLNPTNSSFDIEREFVSRTGYELARTEGKQTKQNKNLMGQRLDVYNGEEIDITAHVRYGNKSPNCLRIHYHVHRDENKLIVGHCGDHMDTAGTRRRK